MKTYFNAGAGGKGYSRIDVHACTDKDYIAIELTSADDWNDCMLNVEQVRDLHAELGKFLAKLGEVEKLIDGTSL